MSLPCELCGADDSDDCACPPCPCKWCRHQRGDPLTEMERGAIARHERAMQTEEVSASAARMRAKIESQA